MFELLLCIITVEALTQLVCKAEIFDTVRNWIKGLSAFTNKLLSCPYCVSVWMSMFTVCLYYFYPYTEWFMLILVMHRTSNLLHDSYKIVQNFKIDQILNRN